jgi:spore maturation protein SpmB
LKPSSVVYWSRFFIAIATGIGSVVALKGVVTGELATVVYTTVAIVVYALTVAFYRYGLRYGVAELKTKNRAITLGIGTYIFAWLASVTVIYTLLGLH